MMRRFTNDRYVASTFGRTRFAATLSSQYINQDSSVWDAVGRSPARSSSAFMSANLRSTSALFFDRTTFVRRSPLRGGSSIFAVHKPRESRKTEPSPFPRMSELFAGDAASVCVVIGVVGAEVRHCIRHVPDRSGQFEDVPRGAENVIHSEMH